MKKKILIAIFLLLQSTAVFAWKEPNEFRGIKWGASPQEVIQALKAETAKKQQKGHEDTESEPKLWNGEVLTKAHIGNIPVILQFSFLDNRFAKVAMVFDSDRVDALLTIFKDRYGPPTAEWTQVVQNRMGAKFTNILAAWKGQKINLLFGKYSETISDGTAILETKEYTEHYEQKKKKTQTDASKDL